jgi:hypothetical protein
MTTAHTPTTGNPRTAAYRAGGRRIEASRPARGAPVIGGRKDCVHHWVIDPPQAGVSGSDGACKRCGAQRHFDGPSEVLDRDTWNGGAGSLVSRLGPTVDESDWHPADER